MGVLECCKAHHSNTPSLQSLLLEWIVIENFQFGNPLSPGWALDQWPRGACQRPGSSQNARQRQAFPDGQTAVWPRIERDFSAIISHSRQSVERHSDLQIGQYWNQLAGPSTNGMAIYDRARNNIIENGLNVNNFFDEVGAIAMGHTRLMKCVVTHR